MTTELPCGCRLCGCACHAHSQTRQEWLCSTHVNQAVFKFAIDEACRLVAIALFAGVVMIAAAVLSTS